MKKRYILFILGLVLNLQAFAQGEQIDFMRSIGKIYVVVAVILVILLGLFYYLFRMDKNLTKLENQINRDVRAKK
ncbi:MAG: CcmD family protein [Saprospiraceae bacterium]|jgi:fumarate reductase subunit D|nr:CcmD family protein [Saprospiraceae bacterium]